MRIYLNLDHIPVDGGSVHVDFLVDPVDHLLLGLPLQLLLLPPGGIRHLLVPSLLRLPPDLISLECVVLVLLVLVLVCITQPTHLSL